MGGAGAPWYAEWLAHPDLADPYWDHRRTAAALERVTVPTLLISGFYDLFAEQTMQQYQTLRRRGVQAALTVGPWSHITVNGGIATRETLAWLDAFAAGDGPTPRPQPVRAWISGSEQWRDCRNGRPWARPNGFWHLHGGGMLAETVPVGDEAATGFRYDPLDPTPTVGGRISSFHGGSRDNTAVEARDDVLTFSTAPLRGAVHVAGVPSVRLRVGHDGACADIFARLCDVDERGRSPRPDRPDHPAGPHRAGGRRHPQRQPPAHRRVARVPARPPDQAAGVRRRVPPVRAQPRHHQENFITGTTRPRRSATAYSTATRGRRPSRCRCWHPAARPAKAASVTV